MMNQNLRNIKQFDKFNVVITYPDKTHSVESIEYLDDIWWEESCKLLIVDYDMLCYNFLCSDYSQLVNLDIIDELNKILNPNKYFCIKPSQGTIIFYNGYLTKKQKRCLIQLNKKYNDGFSIYFTRHKTFL